MSGVTAGTVLATAAVAGTAYSVYAGEESRKAASTARSEAKTAALKQQSLQEQAMNKTNSRRATADLLAPPAGTTPGTTTLTGAQGAAVDTSLLGRNSLLGG